MKFLFNKIFFVLLVTNINLLAENNEKNNLQLKETVCGIIQLKENSANYFIYENDYNGITFENKDKMKKNNAKLLHLGKCSKDIEK